MTFETAFAFVIEKEGGEVNDPRDNGGHTKYGISQKEYPDLDISALTVEQAKEIYRSDYWLRAGCDGLPEGLGIAVFDSAVNQGVGKAIKLLQRSLRVAEDGAIGPMTLAAMKRADPNQLIENYCTERALHYASLDDFPTFGRGWLRRLFHVARIA